MTIFSNRTIHSILERLGPALGLAKAGELRQRLSSTNGTVRISAEWELAVFQCLAAIGELEFPDETKRSADVIFKDHTSGEQLQIEITAVSDSGLDDENPVDEFLKRLHKVTHQLQEMTPGAINYNIGHIEVEGRFILGVPERRNMDAFFRSAEFITFLCAIRSNPSETLRYDFECRGAKSNLLFQPRAKYSSGGHIAHDVILDLKRNHIVNRLKKKAHQINKSGRELPAIVVLCDGGCRVMSSQLSGPGMPRLDEVINVFLNGRPHQQVGPWLLQKGIPQGSRRINAVIVISIREECAIYNSMQRRFDICCFMNKNDVLHPLGTTVAERIINGFRHLPKISMMPVNAKNTFRYPPHYGGGSISIGRAGRMKTKLSLLTLQGLLSGEISHAEFLRDHGDIGTVITKAIREGKMISKLEIERCSDEDDDWVHLELDQPLPDKLFRA